MFTSGINHNSNGYYSTVMVMSTTLCLRQGRDNPMEAYYRRFEATISMAGLEKCNASTHMTLNKYYMDGDNEDGAKRFQ